MANGEINSIHPPALDSCDFYRNIECSYSFVAPLGFPAADQDAKESQTNALSALCCESLSSCTLLGRRCVPFWAEVSWFKKSPGLSTLQFRWTNIMYNSMTTLGIVHINTLLALRFLWSCYFIVTKVMWMLAMCDKSLFICLHIQKSNIQFWSFRWIFGPNMCTFYTFWCKFGPVASVSVLAVCLYAENQVASNPGRNIIYLILWSILTVIRSNADIIDIYYSWIQLVMSCDINYWYFF